MNFIDKTLDQLKKQTEIPPDSDIKIIKNSQTLENIVQDIDYSKTQNRQLSPLSTFLKQLNLDKTSKADETDQLKKSFDSTARNSQLNNFGNLISKS